MVFMAALIVCKKVWYCLLISVGKGCGHFSSLILRMHFYLKGPFARKWRGVSLTYTSLSLCHHPYFLLKILKQFILIIYAGKTWKVGPRGRVHILPFIIKNPTGPLRSDACTRSNAKNAVSANLPVRTLFHIIYFLCTEASEASFCEIFYCLKWCVL